MRDPDQKVRQPPVVDIDRRDAVIIATTGTTDIILPPYQTMVAAFEDGDDTVIYEGLMENQKQRAILAAETVDLRAGNAVRRALG